MRKITNKHCLGCEYFRVKCNVSGSSNICNKYKLKTKQDGQTKRVKATK